MMCHLFKSVQFDFDDGNFRSGFGIEAAAIVCYCYISTTMCFCHYPFLYQAILDPHFISRGGGSSGPPTISLTLDCTNLKFCKVLDIPFKVSENTRFAKKSFVWLPWQLFDNMVLFANNCQNEYEKQVFFKCSQKPQMEGVKIKLCVMIVLFLYFSKN